MATQKDASQDLQIRMDELRKRLLQKDEAIKLAIEKKAKEEELIEGHKRKVKKYEEEIKKFNFEKKIIRMDMMDAAADISMMDRNQFFENAVESAIKNTPDVETGEKSKSEESEDESNSKLETNSEDKAEPKPEINKTITEEQSKAEDKIVTPLDKARAEFMKKHPEGFAGVASSRKES